jgi:membrane-associated phospholipid phosphatase
MTVFSKIISWVFLPLFMPLYGLLIVIYTPSFPTESGMLDTMYLIIPDGKKMILIVFAIFGIVAPGFSFLMLKRQKVIQDIQMPDARERSGPMLMMSFYCLVLYGLFVYQSPNGELPKYCYGLPLAGTVVIAIATFINRYFKISLHAIGAGLLTGFLFAYYSEQLIFNFIILVSTVLVSGIVMSSRLYLNKHSLKEVCTGFLLSSLLTFVFNFYYPI